VLRAPGARPGATGPGHQPDAQSHLDGSEELRAGCGPLHLQRPCLGERLSPHGRTDVTTVTKLTLRKLAERSLSLEEEVKEIDRLLKTLVAETAPELTPSMVGTDVDSAILVARRQPERLKSESTFAKLCGSALDASSGKQQRHRLNRSGTPANSALWHIVFTRMVKDPRTSITSSLGCRKGGPEGGDPLLQALCRSEVFARSHDHNSLLQSIGASAWIGSPSKADKSTVM